MRAISYGGAKLPEAAQPKRSVIDMSKLLSFAVCTACLALPTPTVSASLVGLPGGVTVSLVGSELGGEQRSWNREIGLEVGSDGGFAVDGVEVQALGWDVDGLYVSGNIDPFISQGFSVTNTAAVPISFTITTTVPITPIPGATTHGGSVGYTLTDANNDGVATVTASGSEPFFSGELDGISVLTLLGPLSDDVSFAGQTVSGDADAGLPGPTLPSGSVLASMSIIQKFTLTPGDRLSSTAFFVVEPELNPNEIVPEPVSAAVYLGIIGLWSGVAMVRHVRSS